MKLLENRGYFSFNNHSVPKNDPIHTNGSDKQLYQAIYNRIRGTHVVLIMAGVYSSHSRWIDKEIAICKNDFSSPKPIIAIEPWGSQRTSTIVTKAADKVVGWRADSVVSAIRELV